MYLNDYLKNSFNDFIVPKYLTVANTNLQNRTQVFDTSNMLQALAPIERVPFKGLNLLQKEFGPNGEPVYELESKDIRVRLIGTGWTVLSNNHGTYVSTGLTTDFVEVVFYGAGLNLVCGPLTTGGDWRLTLDNGAEGANFLSTTLSNILSGRSYAPNTVINVTNGLSTTLHVAKIRAGSTANLSLNLSGIEVLNASTSLSVTPGQAFIGNKKESLNTISTSSYSAGFTGNKGGRLVKYLLNGAISQVVRECPVTPSYLTATDHTNEEIVKRVNWREFGANRADDFSTLSSARGAAFALDDGGTLLTASSVNNNTVGGFDVLQIASNGNFWMITFTGSGLDLMQIDSAAGGTDNYTATIDGVTTVSLPSAGVASLRQVKICSGLPYGTHTVKVTRVSAATFSLSITDFIIYQPKAPSIPTGALLVGDYNVVANYVPSATPPNASIGYISQGVIRKLNTRDVTYSGTGWASFGFTLAPSGFQGGWNLGTQSIVGDYVEINFYGVGIEYRVNSSGGHTPNWIFSVDGSSNLTGLATYDASFTGLAFTASTGNLVGTTQAVSGPQGAIRVTGLTLGWHKLRVTNNSTGVNNVLYTDCYDVISPIHVNHPSLKIGSLTLFDNAKIQALSLPLSGPDLSKAKAWLCFDQASSKILGSYNISQVLESGSNSTIYFTKPFKNSNYAVSGLNAGGIRYISESARSNNYITVNGMDYAGGASVSVISVIFHGELLDE